MLTGVALTLLLASGVWMSDTGILVLRVDIGKVQTDVDNLITHVDTSVENASLTDTVQKDMLQKDIGRLIQQAVADLTTTIQQHSQPDNSKSSYNDIIQKNENLKSKISDVEEKTKKDEAIWKQKVEEAVKSCTCNESNTQGIVAPKGLKCGPAPVHLGASVVSRQSGEKGGEIINYECQHGFTYISGSKSAWCHANGTMEMPTMYCKEPKCSDIPKVAGARPDHMYRTPDGHIKAHFVCQKGLKYYSGTTTVDCKDDGKWEIPTILCASEDCFYFNGKKAIYDGPVNITMSGRNCQRWDSNTPHGHPKNNNSPKEFDTDLSMDEVGNKCRDPEDDPFPWCYTMDPKKRWEYCNVPLCVF